MAKTKLDPASNKLIGSAKAKRIAADTATHVFLAIMCIIWLIPFIWLLAHSFRETKGQFTNHFFPEDFTFDNYTKLFTDRLRQLLAQHLLRAGSFLLHQPAEVEDA